MLLMKTSISYLTTRSLTWVVFLALASFVPARAADVAFFGVVKGQKYIQEAQHLVRLEEHGHDDPLYIEAFVDLEGANTINGATVQIPGGQVFVLDPEGTESYRITANFESLLDLNAQFPDGTYTLTINTKNNGVPSISLNLTGSAYPSIPRVSNFNDAQSVNVGNSFTVMWDAPGMTANDFVQLTVEDLNGNVVYETGAPGEGLNGTDTQHTIPGGRLQPGRIYEATLMFAKIVQMDSSSYGGGVTGVAAYLKETHFHIVTTGGTDTQPPQLWQTSPHWGEQGVNVRSTVAFRFSEKMQSSVAGGIQWTGTGINPANFVYTWSTDQTVLFATYTPGFPTSTTISWELNPSPSGSTVLKDLAGNALPGGNMGHFETSSQPATSEPDVELFTIAKFQYYRQTGATPEAEGFAAEIASDLTSLNAIKLAALQFPSGNSFNFEGAEFGNYLDVESSYTSKTDMDRFFPSSGTYTVNLTTAHDGVKSVSLSLPADDYPVTPTVSNLGSLQAINASQPFTINWNSFTSPGANGMIWVEIENEQGRTIYESPDEGPGALTSSSTSITIPAGTLAPGRKYEVTLVFSKAPAVNTSAYQGARFEAGFAKSTWFEVQTSGTPLRPTLAAGMGRGEFFVTSGEKQWQYQVEATTDFSFWVPLTQTLHTSDEGTGYLSDSDAYRIPLRFYRIKDAPENYHPGFVAIHGTVTSQGTGLPIAGAVVSTSLDGRTTTTDSSGQFFLQTMTLANYSNTPYQVTITKSGFQNYSQNHTWGDQPRNLFFQLNPIQN